jgi:hypothetical protein
MMSLSQYLIFNFNSQENVETPVTELAPDGRFLLRRNIYCISCAIGIIVCFAAYGYIMEHITRGCYGNKDEHGKCSTGSFKYAQTLSAVLFFFYWAVAKGTLIISVCLSKKFILFFFHIYAL